jgi:hypothetical protein
MEIKEVFSVWTAIVNVRQAQNNSVECLQRDSVANHRVRLKEIEKWFWTHTKTEIIALNCYFETPELHQQNASWRTEGISCVTGDFFLLWAPYWFDLPPMMTKCMWSAICHIVPVLTWPQMPISLGNFYSITIDSKHFMTVKAYSSHNNFNNLYNMLYDIW